MNLFGWKMAGRASARPASARVALSRLGSVPLAGAWPRSYESQVRELYLANAVAQASVRLVAQGLAAAPIKASDDVALALVKATSAGQSLLECVTMQLLLHGNAYVEIIGGADARPAELYALRPERVSIAADSRGWPSSFVYRVGNAVTRIPADRMIHLRLAHPLDDHYGLGCLAGAAGAIAIHNAAARWNKALLDNAARPSGALVNTASEALSAEQFDRLKAELESGFAGADNAGRPLLLDGGLSWQAMSLSPADMDFVGLKAAAAREIALAFGVPPMLLGLPDDATYANYREANRALWRQAILPLAAKVLGGLAEGLLRWFPALTLAVDLDQVTALAEDREQLWAQLDAASFLTVNEKRVGAGFPALDPESPEPDQAPEPDATEEVKFNPWHDPDNGQFTFASQGTRSSGGTAAMAKPPEKAKPLRDQGGGGGFHAGGASSPLLPPHKPPRVSPTIARPSPSKNQRKPSSPLNKPLAATRPLSSAPVASARVHRRFISASTETRRIEANGYKFDVDSAERTVRASGELRLQPTQRRSPSAQRDAGRPDRLPKDHGGHFTGRQFAGPEIRENHFAQNARFNQSGYKKLEGDWKGFLRGGQRVSVDIRAEYSGGSKRPSQLNVTYYVNGERKFRRFPNEK